MEYNVPCITSLDTINAIIDVLDTWRVIWSLIYTH